MDIKEQVAHESVKKARLLFVGPIHAGKSSFINAVASIDKERIATPMECGESTKSLSKKVKCDTVECICLSVENMVHVSIVCCAFWSCFGKLHL